MNKAFFMLQVSFLSAACLNISHTATKSFFSFLPGIF